MAIRCMPWVVLQDHSNYFPCFIHLVTLLISPLFACLLHPYMFISSLESWSPWFLFAYNLRLRLSEHLTDNLIWWQFCSHSGDCVHQQRLSAAIRRLKNPRWATVGAKQSFGNAAQLFASLLSLGRRWRLDGSSVGTGPYPRWRIILFYTDPLCGVIVGFSCFCKDRSQITQYLKSKRVDTPGPSTSWGFFTHLEAARPWWGHVPALRINYQVFRLFR